MDEHYLPHYNYCEYSFDRTNGCPNPCGDAESMHQIWSGQHQMGEPHSNSFHYGWESQPNFGQGEGNDQGVPNFHWEPVSQFEMLDPSHMTTPTQHPLPSEDDELKQLLVMGFSEINAKLDEERSISESCFSNVLKRMEQMEVKHEHLYSRVMQLSYSMSKQPTIVEKPIPSDSLALLEDDIDEEDAEVEETIIC